jgi:uncharacterized protein (DUF169 family)
MNWHISRNAVKAIENHFGVRGVGIRLVGERPNDSLYTQVRNVRFCEAVSRARHYPVLIDKQDLSCAGARLAFGLNDAHEGMLIRGLMEKRAITKKAAIKLVSSIPRYGLPFRYILLNGPDPEAVIFYFTPERFMEFLKVFQKSGKTLNVSLSSVMALCGDVAVRTLAAHRISVSFGCQDSREYGGVGREELIVGMHSRHVSQFAKLLGGAPIPLRRGRRERGGNHRPLDAEKHSLTARGHNYANS